MRPFGALLLMLIPFLPAAALAENWVEVTDREDFDAAYVDADSIRLGPDGLVYFTARTAGKDEHAADCARQVLYTLRSYLGTQAYDRPGWRSEGRVVVPQSFGEAILRYACAHA